jgi:hypothetical protein
MVLTEQQKKDLVERLKNGREKKAKEVAKVEKVEKKTKAVKAIPVEEPLPIEPIKVEKKTKAVATKAVATKAPVDEPILTTRIVESSDSELEPIDENIEEPVEQVHVRPSTLKDKKNKNKNKFLTIKFHQQPTSEFYKKVISSIQPDEPPKSYSYEKLPDKLVKITDQEKEETERKIKEVQMRDLIYRTLG